MKKFLVTLIKSTFFTWLALFTLIYPAVMLTGGAINGLELGYVSGNSAGIAVAVLTVLFFSAFWVHAYADSFSSMRANLRMKWMLRGVDKE